MALNPYFSSGGGLSSGIALEQNLIENLYTEAVKIYGHEVYYMPREMVNVDEILGEDEYSKFEFAYPIEMYFNQVTGYEGEGDLMTKFGLDIRNTASLVVLKSRWQTEVGVHQKSVTKGRRPAEGDLIFFPLTNALFEIKFVETKDVFYQAHKLYTYRLDVELYVHNAGDSINTGVNAIDAVLPADSPSRNLFDYQIILESGDVLRQENGDSFILESFNLGDELLSDATGTIEPIAQNTDFLREAEQILDFTVRNPFGDLGAR